jgi:spermidine synthase
VPNDRPQPGRRLELLRDDDRGWLLLVDGVPQSYVDPTDPTYLDFDYVRRIASVIDAAFPSAQPLSVVHVGGAGLTLPRWVAATRPRSRQLVLEPDGEVTALVRERLPLPRASGIRVRPQDGRAGTASRRDATADVVVLDAFVDGRVPSELTTQAYAADVARVLRPGGVYVANIADAPPLSFARRFTASLSTVFDEVLVVADPSVLRGRRFGNLVVVGSSRGDGIDLDGLTRGVRSGAVPARVVAGEQLRRFRGGSAPLTDAELAGPTDGGGSRSPEPPSGTWRVPRI